MNFSGILNFFNNVRDESNICMDYFKKLHKNISPYNFENSSRDFSEKEKWHYFEKLESCLYAAIKKRDVNLVQQMISEAQTCDEEFFYVCHSKLLEYAIKLNSYEIVCLLLYYGYYNQLLENPLMFSMYCKADTDIQRLLLNYEDDLDIYYTGKNLLFEAIIHKSAIVLELVERGANVNYFDGENNVISLALITGVESNILEVLWTKFDYNVWRETFSKSVIIKFLQDWFQTDNRLNISYLKIFMENEQKLALDVEHHNNSYFWKSDNIISLLFQRYFDWKIPEQLLQSYVLHLLSYGVFIFEKNLDEFYNFSKNKSFEFLSILLYMDLLPNDDLSELSPMYFHYTLEPNLNVFLNYIWSNVIFAGEFDNIGNAYLCYLNYATLFSIPNNCSKESLYELRKFLDPSYENFKSLVEFSSLVQLSRDAARKAICSQFRVKNSCHFYTIVKCLDIPEYLKEIILFKKKIY